MIVIYKHLAGQHNQSTHGTGGSFKDIDRPNLQNPKASEPYYATNRARIDGGNPVLHQRGTEGYDSVKNDSGSGYSTDELVALREYSYGGDRKANGLLRGKQEATPEAEKIIKGLDSAMEGSYLKQDTALYRGVGGDIAISLNYGNGVDFQDSGFTSTTTDYETARGFGLAVSQSDYAVMKINVPKGTKALALEPFSYWRDEREILLNRGGIFKYKGVTKDGFGRDIFEFDYIEAR